MNTRWPDNLEGAKAVPSVSNGKLKYAFLPILLADI
jgi:hypothetical protein